jgi:ornithine carbamoyltransferase
MNAVASPLALKRDLLTGTEWSPAQLRDFFRLATEMKAHPDRYRTALLGSVFVLIFEKPSLRTRVTFEVGIANLGGTSTFLDHTAARLSEREPVRDIAKNLERWVQGIVARVFAQETLEELAANANVPVINALSDKYHPCQALADFFTLEERFGRLRGLKLAYVGDGNNMCHSLLTIGARAGAHIRVATPAGYEPDATIVADAKRVAK